MLVTTFRNFVLEKWQKIGVLTLKNSQEKILTSAKKILTWHSNWIFFETRQVRELLCKINSLIAPHLNFKPLMFYMQKALNRLKLHEICMSSVCFTLYSKIPFLAGMSGKPFWTESILVAKWLE